MSIAEGSPVRTGGDDPTKIAMLGLTFKANTDDMRDSPAIDIAKALFRKLATKGTVFSPEHFRSIKATYYRIALDFVETYRNDALMNGLDFDIHQEEASVEMFSRNIMDAGQIFLENPMETPFIPSWNRVQSALPDIFTRLYEAVEADHAEFSKENA